MPDCRARPGPDGKSELQDNLFDPAEGYGSNRFPEAVFPYVRAETSWIDVEYTRAQFDRFAPPFDTLRITRYAARNENHSRRQDK
jgi:hypothetical protein